MWGIVYTRGGREKIGKCASSAISVADAAAGLIQVAASVEAGWPAAAATSVDESFLDAEQQCSWSSASVKLLLLLNSASTPVVSCRCQPRIRKPWELLLTSHCPWLSLMEAQSNSKSCNQLPWDIPGHPFARFPPFYSVFITLAHKLPAFTPVTTMGRKRQAKAKESSRKPKKDQESQRKTKSSNKDPRTSCCQW